MYNMLKNEWKKGASCVRDNIIGHIIGMQNNLGNNVEDKGYQQLDKLLDLIEERYGKMFGEFIG